MTMMMRGSCRFGDDDNDYDDERLILTLYLDPANMRLWRKTVLVADNNIKSVY